MSKLGRWDVPVIFAAALAVRAAFAWETRADPLFQILAIDARSYFELASWFAGGDWLYAQGNQPLWFAPLYPTLLGALFRVVGPSRSG